MHCKLWTMAPRPKKQHTNLPPLPRFHAWCAFEASKIASHLKFKHHATKWQIDYTLGCLSKRYLVSLGRVKTDPYQLYDRSPHQIRWLWETWASQILGWKQRRPQGHLDGLSNEVYIILYEKIYTFSKVERADQE